MTYFSDRENGEKPRENEEINELAWKGIRSEIESRVDDGSFGKIFPENCENGRGVTGSHEINLRDAMRARVSKKLAHGSGRFPWSHNFPMPQTLVILDLIEFCWKNIAQPKRNHHKHCDHDHLQFDVEEGWIDIEEGREKFREAINEIFSRNGLAYELKENGQIERFASPVLRELLASAQFQTRDEKLNELLETALSKFFTHHPNTRRESLDHLWDAWERLKTLGEGSDKKNQITDLLMRASGEDSPKFRKALEQESRELTQIGNKFKIRHSEVEQESLAKDEHVDYLFHRLFSLIWMILKITEI